MTTMTWQDKAIAATQGSRFGAILACAMGREIPAPHFHGKASITSDGFLMCDFTDRDGRGHMGAFVGAASDLDANVAGLAKHLKLTADDKAALEAVIDGWIATDWRREATAKMGKAAWLKNEED